MNCPRDGTELKEQADSALDKALMRLRCSKCQGTWIEPRPYGR